MWLLDASTAAFVLFAIILVGAKWFMGNKYLAACILRKSPPLFAGVFLLSIWYALLVNPPDVLRAGLLLVGYGLVNIVIARRTYVSVGGGEHLFDVVVSSFQLSLRGRKYSINADANLRVFAGRAAVVYESNGALLLSSESPSLRARIEFACNALGGRGVIVIDAPGRSRVVEARWINRAVLFKYGGMEYALLLGGDAVLTASPEVIEVVRHGINPQLV